MRSKEKKNLFDTWKLLNIKNNSKSRLLRNQPGVQTQRNIEEVKDSCWEKGIVETKWQTSSCSWVSASIHPGQEENTNLFSLMPLIFFNTAKIKPPACYCHLSLRTELLSVLDAHSVPWRTLQSLESPDITDFLTQSAILEFDLHFDYFSRFWAYPQDIVFLGTWSWLCSLAQ